MKTSRPSPARRQHRPLWCLGAILAVSLPPLRFAAAADGPADPRIPAAAPSAAAAALPTAAPATPDAEAPVDDKATAKIPKRLLRQVLGCWQLDGQERWVITRLDATGAQVVSKPLRGKARPAFPDRARRAAVPATLMYDGRKGNFGFATAGRHRLTLVVFSPSGSTLEASLYAKRTRRGHYAPTGNTATLVRCKVPKSRLRTKGPHTPPRLQQRHGG